MESGAPLKVLLVAEGSGGHLIPALQVATMLAQRGVRTKVWYAQRRYAAPLASALAQEAAASCVDVAPIPLPPSSGLRVRLWQCAQLLSQAQRYLDTFCPDVVVGFGGWVSAPLILAARRRRIKCLLHEQNVVMGRANRMLAHWVNRVAVSFPETQAMLDRIPSVVTGMPIRQGIGQVSRSAGAERFGFDPNRPTILVIGGSQGARAINRLMTRVAARLSTQERATWQIAHVTGLADEEPVRNAYVAQHLTAWVAPVFIEMAAAYAQADLVIARAGASTIAELARCGTPSILIPYPYAGGHQRANARLVETIGGGLMIEESAATPERLLGAVRQMLSDERLRAMMGAQVHALCRVDAAQRLAHAILELAHARDQRPLEPAPAAISDGLGSAPATSRDELLRAS